MRLSFSTHVAATSAVLHYNDRVLKLKFMHGIIYTHTFVYTHPHTHLLGQMTGPKITDLPVATITPNTQILDSNNILQQKGSRLL